MKKLFLSISLLFSLFLVFSCKEGTPKSAKEEFIEGLSSADTTAMLNGCDACMELLKQGKIEQALDSLYEYTDSTASVTPLSAEMRARYTRNFNLFPVHQYVLEYFSFQLEGLNDVRYKVQFSPDDAERPAYTAFMFNPVRINGRWYITVKTADQEFDESHQ